MKLLKIILLPILTVFYIFHYIVLIIRNKLYDYKIFKTYYFNSTKIISVGNLKFGGTGKTPLVEYLISILPKSKIALLSRGYKRKSSGFLFAQPNHSANELGDEINQVSKKNLNLTVAVDENRVSGVKKIIQKSNKKIIILDDGYQHRKIGRDLNILVTEYSKLYSNDYLYPLGNLREYRSESKRADLIVVTKSPKNISNKEKIYIKNKLSHSNQNIFFSYIKEYTFIHNKEIVKINKKEDFFLVTGIASPNSLIEKMNNMKINFHHFQYNDHHFFKKSEITYLIKIGQLRSVKNIIFTEKDFYRLSEDNLNLIKSYFKLYYIQIKFDFIQEEKSMFNKQILKFI